MFTCIECGKERAEETRVIVGKDLCLDCYNSPAMSEGIVEVAPGVYNKPPKYMIDPSEYEKYGYSPGRGQS